MKTSIIALLLVVVLAGGLTFGANSLLSYAVRRDAVTAGSGAPPKTSLSREDVLNLSRGWETQSQRSKNWLASSAVEKVQIRSAEGFLLSGEAVITDPASHRWLIAVHGYRGSHSYMAVPASRFGEEDYNALLPDLRGCGESEGRYIGMGWPDRKDMLRWIDWILERDSAAQIVLYGISMGGATVMMTAGEELPDQVKAVVEDCGYTSVTDIFADEMKALFHLPAFPLLNIADFLSPFRAGYSFSDASALKQLAHARVPVLFIHGSADPLVQTEMVYRVYEACTSEKELLIVDGAGHGNSFAHAPELYFDTVFRFLNRYMD